MRKFNAENERIKRAYTIWLREAKGRDQTTIDKVRLDIVKFEQSTKFKSFKKFHIDQAVEFKACLSQQLNSITRMPLSLGTIDSTLRTVKAFFEWLSREPGYRKILKHTDAEYFNNNMKDSRAVHAHRPVQYPSKQSAFHAFQALPERTELQRRDKAVFAFLMLTGARDGATASFRLKHINLVDGTVFQDGREVKTKNSKTFTTTFFPVEPEYLKCFTAWVTYLREVKMFGSEDALFPKPKRKLLNGKFAFNEVSREPYSNASKINAIVRSAFAAVQMPEYTPHSFRKTLMQFMSDLNLPLDAQKAWSQNLGHEHFNTSVSAYLPVSQQRQRELISQIIG